MIELLAVNKLDLETVINKEKLPKEDPYYQHKIEIHLSKSRIKFSFKERVLIRMLSFIFSSHYRRKIQW